METASTPAMEHSPSRTDTSTAHPSDESSQSTSALSVLKRRSPTGPSPVLPTHQTRVRHAHGTYAASSLHVSVCVPQMMFSIINQNLLITSECPASGVLWLSERSPGLCRRTPSSPLSTVSIRRWRPRRCEALESGCARTYAYHLIMRSAESRCGRMKHTSRAYFSSLVQTALDPRSGSGSTIARN